MKFLSFFLNSFCSQYAACCFNRCFARNVYCSCTALLYSKIPGYTKWTYSDIQEQIIILRNITKNTYIPLVKSLMTNNRQTWASLLCHLWWNHKSREISVTYLIYLILLPHLQLIRPLYELFLEIIKDPCCL